MEFFFVKHALLADPPLGKVDKAYMSQQTLMELLIEGITMNKQKICGDLNDLKDITEWEAVYLTLSDEIMVILWRELRLEGSIEFKWLPLTTQKVDLTYNRFHGTADLTCLPDGLNYFYLSENRFSGTVDLTRLPPNLKRISLYSNIFHGVTDFSQLPESLKYLNVEATRLEGEVYTFDGILRSSKVKDLRY